MKPMTKLRQTLVAIVLCGIATYGHALPMFAADANISLVSISGDTADIDLTLESLLFDSFIAVSGTGSASHGGSGDGVSVAAPFGWVSGAQGDGGAGVGTAEALRSLDGFIVLENTGFADADLTLTFDIQLSASIDTADAAIEDAYAAVTGEIIDSFTGFSWLDEFLEVESLTLGVGAHAAAFSQILVIDVTVFAGDFLELQIFADAQGDAACQQAGACAQVPEPGTLGLLFVGLLLAVLSSRMREPVRLGER